MNFKALWVTQTPEGVFQRDIVERSIDELPPGEVLVRVHYSSLNYKDALCATGQKGITKKYPHTPGIDAAGVVEISRHEAFAAGDEVIITGHDLGMNTSGGFAQFVRVPASWIVQKPEGYTLQEAMCIGTAGFTAAIAIHKMQLMGLQPGNGPIVVTGATGGVGSVSVAVLAKLGFEVIATTGKTNANEYLTFLGASRIEDRSFVSDESGKALLSPRWAGAIDTVGGNTLATLLKGCQLEGVVVSTGLAGSARLDATVYPFILNGVSLLGVGSAESPRELRELAWSKLEKEWNIREKLPTISKEISLEELNEKYIDCILQGKLMGRVVVSLK